MTRKELYDPWYSCQKLYTPRSFFTLSKILLVGKLLMNDFRYKSRRDIISQGGIILCEILYE